LGKLAAELRRQFGLTEREAEIACELMRSSLPRDIVRRLGISINTFKTHRRHIYDKIGVRRQAELIVVGFAVESLLRQSAPAGDEGAHAG
jgi:DNA-binding CsgD family transcriptional regulator